MGDVIIDVPGGSNNHNYANVTLIVELARLHGVHAVWAGWGHASENPQLPNKLAASQTTIKFIGPARPSMQALGDKNGSTIIAQSAGVPCIAWNGQDDSQRRMIPRKGRLPDDVYERGSSHSPNEATTASLKWISRDDESFRGGEWGQRDSDGSHRRPCPDRRPTSVWGSSRLSHFNDETFRAKTRQL
mmetsp:Transcript_10792/g.11573  ORF Transcript_10792/g.11573 Transcript_10792/m.11573 type:complete len:188 (-) Transcript_10792:578-1141(-)